MRSELDGIVDACQGSLSGQPDAARELTDPTPGVTVGLAGEAQARGARLLAGSSATHATRNCSEVSRHRLPGEPRPSVLGDASGGHLGLSGPSMIATPRPSISVIMLTCCTAPAARYLRLFECSRWPTRCGTSQTTAQYTPDVPLAWSFGRLHNSSKPTSASRLPSPILAAEIHTSRNPRHTLTDGQLPT